MAAKSLLVFCASACFVKLVSAQCIGPMNTMAGTALAAEEMALTGNGLANRAGLAAYGAGPLGYPAGYGVAPGYGLAAAPASGGGFPVTSTSPISPTGITVVSENAIEGPLSITGQLPFLGAIALEGALPTAGAGAINYGCGNGAVGIVSEGIAPAMAPAAYPAGLGYGPAGLAGGMGYPGMAGPRTFNGLGMGYGPSISAQCIGNVLAAEEFAYAGSPLAYNGLANGLAYGAYGLAPGYGSNGIAPASGGGFPVTSTSPIYPTGITVISENAIEGALSIAGELPFLGAVALEGALPTAGAGGINYGCGNGAVGIVSEGIAPAYGPMGPSAMAPGRYGYGAGLPGGYPGGLAAGFGAPGCAAGMAGPGFGYNGLGPYGPMY